MHTADLDTIPLADLDPDEQPPAPRRRGGGARPGPPASRRPSRLARWVAPALIVILCSAHGAAIWFAMGGLAGMTNGWPLWRDRSPALLPLGNRHARVLEGFVDDGRLRSLLHVGICQERRLPFVVDPSRAGRRPLRGKAPRAGLQDLCARLGGGRALADRAGVRAAGGCPPAEPRFAVLLILVYIWTDFPIRYVQSGCCRIFWEFRWRLPPRVPFALPRTRGRDQLAAGGRAHEPGVPGSPHDRDGGGARPRRVAVHCGRSVRGQAVPDAAPCTRS